MAIPFLKGGVNTLGPKCCTGDLSSIIILVYLPLEMWNEYTRMSCPINSTIKSVDLDKVPRGSN